MSADLEMSETLSALAESLEAESGKSLSQIFESDDWSGLPTWDELRHYAKDPLVEIGSHTVTHARLPFVDHARVVMELEESKRRIEQELDRSCYFFCHPSGDFDAPVVALVSRAGYRCGLTSVEGINSEGVDALTLKRVSFPEFDAPAELLTEASGFGSFVSTIAAPLRA